MSKLVTFTHFNPDPFFEFFDAEETLWQWGIVGCPDEYIWNSKDDRAYKVLDYTRNEDDFATSVTIDENDWLDMTDPYAHIEGECEIGWQQDEVEFTEADNEFATAIVRGKCHKCGTYYHAVMSGEIKKIEPDPCDTCMPDPSTGAYYPCNFTRHGECPNGVVR